jgi:hypothetical protein
VRREGDKEGNSPARAPFVRAAGTTRAGKNHVRRGLGWLAEGQRTQAQETGCRTANFRGRVESVWFLAIADERAAGAPKRPASLTAVFQPLRTLDGHRGPSAHAVRRRTWRWWTGGPCK